MRILQINTVCGIGSTGRICTGIADLLKSEGHEAYIAYGLGKSDYPNSINISQGKSDYFIHNLQSRLTDSEGLHSNNGTSFLISQMEQIKPDIIHLHSMHGHYLNYKLLLTYLKEKKLPVVMTLHDCWTFTGHCAHFDQFRCDKWKIGCSHCEHLGAYPQSWFLDKSERNYNLKKRLFMDLGDKLIIVPVSYWLEDLVKLSFLKNQNIVTIHNGIDLIQFRPTYSSNLKNKYHIEGKKVILGVALPWSDYKGLPDFHKLRSLLSEDYAIVLVGLSKKQIGELPADIIGIEKTDNIKELAEIYTMADVLVNTTYCDNYPTVNLEAMACGTPVITYKTGGSPEAISKETGLVIEQGNLMELNRAVLYICDNNRELYRNHCLERAGKLFDKSKCFEQYISLYLTI